MISSKLRSKIDIWFVGLLIVCGVSMSMVLSLVSAGQASAFDLNQTAPKRYYNDLMATPDGCYSNLNEVSQLASLLGSGQWGLVNAIMNVPVYDWDQGTGPELYHAQNAIHPKGALRGDVLGSGQAVGYMKDFNFTETPVPNPYWVQQWLMNPELPVMPKNGDYVANPFIYQQFSAINGSGMPVPALLSGGIPSLGIDNNDDMYQDGNEGDLLEDLDDSGEGLYDEATGGIDDMDDFLGDNDEYRDTALGNSDMLEDQYNSGNLADPDFIGQLVTGVLGFASQDFPVRGDIPADNCYEDMNKQGEYSAPSYAFSVINAGLPITIPGWAYSPITFLDGKSISSSGVTFYMGGTVNDKFILDCYGRGKQPIVVPASYSLVDARAFTSGLGSALANGATAAAIAASTPPICIFVCVPNPLAIYNNLSNTTAIRSAFENYFYGFAFAFKVDPTSTFNLPDYLDRRVINMDNSRFFDVNTAVLAANPAICGDDYHGCSQNGAQFNPDVYVTLKEPYVLNSDIVFDSSEHHRMPDGQSVHVSVDGIKNGFNDGIGGGSYEPYEMKEDNPFGGPTYNDNVTNGRAFTRASVYRIEMKPGVVPNAIDIDRLNTSLPDWQDNTAYRGDPAINDVCSFFHDQLYNGDGLADPSEVPDENGDLVNANEHRSAFDDAEAYDCAPVLDEKSVRMDADDHREALYEVTENIDSETPPGTKICYAVHYDHYTNDIKHEGTPWWDEGADIGNYNSEYATPDNTSYLSRAKCIVVGYKPSFQVRGGDLIAGEGIYTGTNQKDFLAGETNPDGTYKHQRVYGSWAEYGAMAGGVIKQLGTGGSYRLGMPSSLTEYGPLTFSNDRDEDDPEVRNHGNYDGSVAGDDVSISDGFDKIANRFSQAAEKAEILTSEGINLYELEDGTYTLPNGPVSITSEDPDGNATIKKNRSIILLTGDNTIVNIESDIKIPLNYESAGDISQVVIAAQNPGDPDGYMINIADNVREVDAWLINQNGSINTCWIEGVTASDEYRLTPRSLGECDNTLYINGPVSAENILLRRNGGKDQSSDPTELHQSVPGEVFNLRPDAYIWASNHVGSSNKKYITTHVLDLPPRY